MEQSLGRSSLLLGAGTLVSRLTGILRTVVLVWLIGSNRSAVADAFFVANQLPNTVFNLISVGVLTAVIVPQVISAMSAPDGGEAFVSKMFTLGAVTLVLATAAAALLVPWLVAIQLKSQNIEQLALATALAYWCIPQVLFYGIYGLIGETLNARRVFGPFTWAPIVNNILSIVGFLIIGVLFGDNLTNVKDWDSTMVALLGGTATLGIAVQALVLLFFWSRTGLRLRLDFHWRGVGLGGVGRAAGWTFLMALVSTATGFYQSWVSNQASGQGAASAAMGAAWLIYMVPYSLVVYSIGTPYFTRLSEHASADRHSHVKNDISASIRTLGVLLVGAVAAVAAAAVPVSRVFTNSASDAGEVALVLACDLIALIPMGVLFIIQRTFYAYGDTRTPFYFTAFQCVLVVISAFTAWMLYKSGILPVTHIAAAVALGQSIAGTIQTVLATALLRRQLGPLHIRRWATSLATYVLAAIPAGAIGWSGFILLGGTSGWMVADKLSGAAGSAIIGTITFSVYFGFLVIARIPESRVLLSVLRRGRADSQS